METLTESEREFVAILVADERHRLLNESPEEQVFEDRAYDTEIRAQCIERCDAVIRKMGGSRLLGVRE